MRLGAGWEPRSGAVQEWGSEAGGLWRVQQHRAPLAAGRGWSLRVEQLLAAAEEA